MDQSEFKLSILSGQIDDKFILCGIGRKLKCNFRPTGGKNEQYLCIEEGQFSEVDGSLEFGRITDTN